VTRATVRFDSGLTRPLALLDDVAVLGATVAGLSALIQLWRARGGGHVLLSALTLGSVLLCVGLVLERSPGGRLAINATTVYKGPWPHRTFGQWYPPGSRVRSFYASDPRNYYDPPAPLARQWRLNVHSSRDVAELRFDPVDPSAFRVEIHRADGGETWGIQLNQGPIVVRANTAYELRFRARADRERNASVAISEWHPPWETLGFGRDLALTPTWSTWAETLTVLRDDPRARIHFDVGNSTTSMEFADVVLTDLDTGKLVSPDPFPYSVTHQFNHLGCRGQDASAASAPDARRILILGDAYALGLGVRDEDVFGAMLGRHLRELRSGVRADTFDTMTCAAPGWGAKQERAFYEHLRGRYQPQLVIAVVSWNDERLHADESPLPAGLSSPRTDARHLTQELLRLSHEVRSHDGRFAVVFFRNTPSEVWKRTLEALEPLPAAGVPVLDLWSALSGSRSWQELLSDPPHGSLPNEIAHRVAAAAAARFVSTHGLIE
jgi:hypothetical protein